MPTTKIRCQVADQIIEWTSKDGHLNIGEGDLVLENGRFELVTEIHWTPTRDLRVAVGFDGRNALTLKDPGALVAVRRYIETSEE